jgi:hypothetical protein
MVPQAGYDPAAQISDVVVIGTGLFGVRQNVDPVLVAVDAAQQVHHKRLSAAPHHAFHG